MPTSRFTTSPKKYAETAGDLLILPWLDAKTPLFHPSLVPGKLATVKPGKKGSLRMVSTVEKNGKRSAVAVQRLAGEGAQLGRAVKQMVSSAMAKARELSLKRVVIPASGAYPELCLCIQEGALLGGYVFDKYISKKEKPVGVQLVTDAPKSLFKDNGVVAAWTNQARDLLNEPPAAIHPESLAAAFKESGAAAGMAVDVWGEKKLQNENCGGILAVGAGSASKPKLVIGRYNPKGATTHLALVGKGVTFDSGGYSLKPSKSMEEMKLDMGGAAMMWSAACAIAQLGLPIRVTVYCPLAHNAISSSAYNVSDVVTTRNGKTIEVVNTDAEGRIILADALTLACEQKPDYLIDSATLTGAAVVALGEDIAAVYGTDGEFTDELLDASTVSGEYMWEMPLHMPYDREYDSDIADVKNSGGRWGGSILAALFLKRFITNVDKWVHIDIAGPGCRVTPMEHLGKGAKGFGVKTMVELARRLS